ncbi:MAG TPA: polysaccharide biosynthesis/export family protein [bacterium]|nr:polysaccharide biosynthesis/export family protein [bacterium]
MNLPREYAPEASEPYRIGPEDVIEVVVWRHDELGRVVPVRPDGMISLPLLNDVRAEGLTPMELRETIAAGLKNFVVSTPEVAVIVREIHSRSVTLLGEVTRPGRYELRGPTRLLDAVAQAGGFTEYASRRHVVIFRRSDGELRQIEVDRTALLSGGERHDPDLRAGDLVVVP